LGKLDQIWANLSKSDSIWAKSKSCISKNIRSRTAKTVVIYSIKAGWWYCYRTLSKDGGDVGTI